MVVLPREPVTLTPQQVDEFTKKLSHMRHEVNGKLSIIVATAELIRIDPVKHQHRLAALNEQSFKITQEINGFTDEFDRLLGITRA